MSNRYVNQSTVIEAVELTSDMSMKKLLQFTGLEKITFDKEAVYLHMSDTKGVCANYGDMLVKDCKGTLYPLPKDVFSSQFMTISATQMPVLMSARWTGFNTNEFMLKLQNRAKVVDIREDLTAILSNGVRIPCGHFIVHNVDKGTWFTMNPEDYHALFGGN